MRNAWSRPAVQGNRKTPGSASATQEGEAVRSTPAAAALGHAVLPYSNPSLDFDTPHRSLLADKNDPLSKSYAGAAPGARGVPHGTEGPVKAKHGVNMTMYENQGLPEAIAAAAPAAKKSTALGKGSQLEGGWYMLLPCVIASLMCLVA